MKIGVKEVIMASGPFKLKFFKLCDLIFGGMLASLVPAKDTRREMLFPQRVLIIRPGGIGDAVFVLPFLKLLKETRPSLKIDILCEQRNSSVFSSQKSLYNHLYLYDKPSSLLVVFRNQYDVIIDTEQWHYLSALVAYFGHSRCTVGFGSRPLRKKLFNIPVVYDINGHELGLFRELFHPVFQEAETIKSLENSFTVPEGLGVSFPAHIPPNSVAFFPGASLPQKQLNADQALEIINSLAALNYRVVLLGGRDYFALSQHISQKSNEGLVNLVGQTSLLQTAAAIKQTKLFIGTDSGLLHLACALGMPTISVFGPSNRNKWGPRGEGHIVLSDDVSCSPCTHFSYSLPTCRGSYHCMNEFNIEKIKEAIHKRLGTA